MEVRVPTLLEQRRIVEILRAWDEAIDKTKQLIAAKEKRIRGMMCSTLTAPHDHANDWIKTTLGEILTVASRRVAWDEEATYRLITVKRACGGIVYRGDRKASNSYQGHVSCPCGRFRHLKTTGCARCLGYGDSTVRRCARFERVRVSRSETGSAMDAVFRLAEPHTKGPPLIIYLQLWRRY